MIDLEMEGEVSKLIETVSSTVDLNNIEYILDLGTADLGASFAFSRIFPKAKIIAFECNPSSVEKCKETYKKFNPENIIFVDKAVYNKNCLLDFYPVDMINSPSKNWKAGSFFPFNPNYVATIENVIQSKDPVKVEAVKLKDYLQDININKIDIVWADIQGAELFALQGMEDLLSNTRLLHLEVEYDHNPTYLNHPCKSELEKFLFENNFESFGHLLYNQKLVDDPIDYMPNISWANFIYINKGYKL